MARALDCKVSYVSDVELDNVPPFDAAKFGVLETLLLVPAGTLGKLTPLLKAFDGKAELERLIDEPVADEFCRRCGGEAGEAHMCRGNGGCTCPEGRDSDEDGYCNGCGAPPRTK